MSVQITKRGELKNIGYELFIGALSVLSIINLILMYMFGQDEDLQVVLYIMNAIMLPIFLGDFIYRFATADAKAHYFFRDFGWADLLSSLTFPRAKLLRLFRFWRVIRLFRWFGARNLAREFVKHRAENALLTVVFLVLCVLEFGSVAVLVAEMQAPNANITNAPDALWWVYVTITTVGYGDRFPVTNWGRIVGVLVMTAGVGLFGTLSGFLANSFLSPKKADQQNSAAMPDVASTQAVLADIQRMLAAQEQAVAHINARLAEMDRRG